MLSMFKKKKLNIVMIMMDAVRYDALDKVPFYKELKNQSVFFDQVITYAPYTIGSLHSAFSGMYGNLNGVNGYYRSFSFDKEHCYTMPQYFKDNGYHTEADLVNNGVVPNQGFDKIRIYDEFFVRWCHLILPNLLPFTCNQFSLFRLAPIFNLSFSFPRCL